MAANVLLTRMWLSVAILLTIATASLAAVNGRITSFIILPPAVKTTEYIVSSGTNVTFQCQMEYNVSSRVPSISLKKSYSDSSWIMADNDVFINPPFMNDDRFSAIPVDNDPNGKDIYNWIITNVGIGDSGNYTCSVTKSNATSANVTLIVAAEPTELSLFLNDELLQQSSPSLINQKLLKIGQSYRLKCVVVGGNPFPNVTLTSGGNMVLTPSSVTNLTFRYDTPLSVINRTTVSEFAFVMNTTYLGKPFACAAGFKYPNTLYNSFVPLIENVLPHFDCPDQFNFDGKTNQLALTCKVYSQNLTTYFVSWRNKTANLTCRGQKGVSFTLPEDKRYSLLVTAPPGNDVWWTMTLNVDNVQTITDLSNITYNFVASSNTGQAVHQVRVVNKGMNGGPASNSSVTPAISFVALLLGFLAAMTFNQL